MRRPSKTDWPPVGWSSPATMFKSVDFPHPEGPTMQTNSPSLTDSEILSTASVLWRLVWKWRLTPRNAISSPPDGAFSAEALKFAFGATRARWSYVSDVIPWFQAGPQMHWLARDRG